MAHTTTEFTMRPYLRVSQDRSRRERSPEEQNADLDVDAVGQGWKVHPKPYRDIGSASKHQRKARDAFERLIADLAAGQFGADRLGLWEGSRGSRQMHEWVLLVDLLAKQGVLVWVHVRKRLFDPRNAHDRADLLQDAIKHELFSAEVSDRSVRASIANTRAGLPHGKVQFGFLRIYDEKTKDFIEQVHDPEKAPLIAELFKRLKSGHSLQRIWDDWKAQGIVNRNGGPYALVQIRAMALSPAYAGMRTLKDADGAVTYIDGVWEPIVSKEDYFEVKGILEDPARRTQRDTRARHLLSASAAAACDVCSSQLTPFNDRSHGDTPKYRCGPRGHVTVPRVDLDELAVDAILGWLSDPKCYKAAFADRPEEEKAELRKVRDDLAEAQNEWGDLKRRTKAFEVSIAFAAEVEPALLERIRELRAKRNEMETPRKLKSLITPGRGVARRWGAAPIEAQRAIAKFLLSPEYLGQLRLMRSPKRGARGLPVHERVRFGVDEAGE